MEKRGCVVFCLEIAVKFEEFGKERKDESKRYLRLFSKVLHIVWQLGHTKSSNKEMKITRKICFRLAGDTGVADIVGG